METLSERLLVGARDLRCLVVGDAMLDRYWLGDVDRISPEAPVPVVSVKAIHECAGGAGNVAANIAALGSRCELISFAGDDDAGKRLSAILSEAGVGVHLHIDPDGRTTEKLRVVSRNQQLLRIDFESQPNADLIRQSVLDFETLSAHADVVVISDYGKGGLSQISEMISMARAAKRPVIVDPKGEDFSRYHGATIVTPNAHEFEAVTGVAVDHPRFEAAAFDLVQEVGISALLVTQGSEGMSLFSDNGIRVHQDAVPVEVFDVSGAGDTVVALLAVSLGLEFGWSECIKLATQGASAVVSRFGTSVVRISDLAA